MQWWTPIVVAFIAGPMMWMLHRLDKRNSEQHAENGDILSGIRNAVVENRDDLREVKWDIRGLKANHRLLKYEIEKMDAKLDDHVERGREDV